MSNFICSNCSKAYKIKKAYEVHIAKCVVQIAQPVQSSEQNIQTDMAQSFNSEMQTESLQCCEQDVQTDLALTCEMSTQVDQEELEPVKQEQQIAGFQYNQLDRLSLDVRFGARITELPQIIADIQVLSKNVLRIIDGQMNMYNATNCTLFNQYVEENINIHDRVTKGLPELEKKVSLMNYKFDKYEKDDEESTNTKLGMKPHYASIITKMLVENDIQITYPKIEGIYWDIETFNLSHFEVPFAHEEDSYISMLCAVKQRHIMVWVLDKYTFNQESIKQHLLTHLENGYNNITFTITICEDDRQIANGFLQYLSQLKSFHYVSGFNATSANQKTLKREPNCYDMDFIIKKSGISSKSFRISSSKWLTRGELCYSRCDFLPFVLFIDFKQLAHNDVVILERNNKMDGYSLDKILKALGVSSKISIDHKTMALASRTNKSEMSKYIAYCAYDCIGLQIADEKYGMFDQLYSLVQLLNLPIYCIGTMTDNQKLQNQICKGYYSNGYSFTYSSINYKETKDKHGALTEPVQPHDQFKFIDNVNSCDFVSQYPNSMLQMRISPENISEEPTQFGVDINYLKGEQQMVYFKDQETILSVLIKDLLEKKANFKKTKQIAKCNATKICVNTIYGCINQDVSPFYNHSAASSVTGFARLSIDYTRQLFQQNGYNILTIDTDGIECNPIDALKTPQEIAQIVNNKWSYMELEIVQNTQFIFNKCKKAYLKQYISDGKLKMDAKGFGSKNALSLVMRNEINQFCQTLMNIKVQSHEEITVKITEFRKYIGDKLRFKIENNESIIDYTITHKFSKSQNKAGQMTKSGRLSMLFGDKSVYQIVPYNYLENRQDYNWAEYNVDINLSRVQIEKLIDLLIKPVTQFFNNKQKNNTKTLQKEMLDGQIMLAQQTSADSKNQTMINVFIEDIANKVATKHKSVIYHEKILMNKCKLYFDLETKLENGVLITINIDQFKNILNKALKNQYPIHIANGCVPKIKESYHLIVDVLMVKPQMECLAEYINQQMGYNVCDVVVYKKDQQMRLPQQYKYNKQTGKIGSIKLKITSQSVFNDFIVQDIYNKNNQYKYTDISNVLAFSSNPHFGYGVNQINTKAVQYLNEKFQLDCEQNKYQLIPKVKPYTCPITGETHESNNLKCVHNTITCFSEKCKDKKLQIDEEFKEEIKEQPYQQQILSGAIVQNTRFVNYDIRQAKFTYVKSQMNTGKTYALQKTLMQPEFENCYQIVVSFRRTFALDFATKMGFSNYLSIDKNAINIVEHPKIVIQLDSLHRLRLEQIPLNNVVLILDEIESIENQITAFSHKPEVRESISVFTNLIQNARNVVVLDATLEKGSIKLINQIAKNENYQIIHNVYQPKKGFTATCLIDAHTDKFKADYQQNIIKHLEDNKKVVSFCSSKGIADGLVQMAESMGYMVKYYHGEDTKIEKCHNGLNMAQAKQQDFTNLENLKCDLLIYTSTLTAGISFEQKHFDKSINYYAYNTCAANETIQALQRVRNISDQNIIIYIDKTQEYSKFTTPFSISRQKVRDYQCFHQYNLTEELIIYTNARMNEMTANKNKLLLEMLQDQGYTINKQEQAYTEQKLTVVPDQVDYSIKLTENDITLLESIKKSTYILNNKDQQLHSKVHLVRILKLYDITIEQLNELPAETKQKMYKDRDIQVEINAWKHLTNNADLKTIDINSLIPLIRQRENEIRVQNDWCESVTGQTSKKQLDAYGQRLQYLIHYQSMKPMNPEELKKYIKLQSNTFTRSFNNTLKAFSIKLKVKESNHVKTYKFE